MDKMSKVIKTVFLEISKKLKTMVIYQNWFFDEATYKNQFVWLVWLDNW
jgi:hypothetical protein